MREVTRELVLLALSDRFQTFEETATNVEKKLDNTITAFVAPTSRYLEILIKEGFVEQMRDPWAHRLTQKGLEEKARCRCTR